VTETARPRPGPGRLLGRALRLRCPVCGRGALLRTWFALAPRCAACDFSFERDEREDYWLGAYLLNFIVTEVVFALLVLVVLLATWPEPAWSLLTWLGAAQMIVTPILFYPFSKGLWLAGDLLFRPAGVADFEPHADEDRGAS
jgi:uncharacterized protein (DUF983 family)